MSLANIRETERRIYKLIKLILRLSILDIDKRKSTEFLGFSKRT